MVKYGLAIVRGCASAFSTSQCHLRVRDVSIFVRCDTPTHAHTHIEAIIDQGVKIGLPAVDGVCHDFASLFGNIRATNWGPVFNVENKLSFKREEDACSMPDVAYTNFGIPLHVDNPYREPAPGFQLLHCIVQDTESQEGGMNMAADGLHIAHTLRARDDTIFQTLSTVPVKFEYSDGNILLRRARPHIEIDLLKGACGGIGEFGFKAINWSGRLDYVPVLAPLEMTKYFQARETLVEVSPRPGSSSCFQFFCIFSFFWRLRGGAGILDPVVWKTLARSIPERLVSREVCQPTGAQGQSNSGYVQAGSWGSPLH